MKLLIIIISCLLTITNLSFSQNQLYLGKKTFITKTSIKSNALKKVSNVHKRIYFKTDKSRYQPIGFYGKKIESNLYLSNVKIEDKFIQFKKNKFYSQINLVSSLSLFSIWLYRGVSYNLNTGNDNVKQFVLRNKQYLYFLSSIVFFSGSIYFDLKSTRRLKQCVNLNNKF